MIFIGLDKVFSLIKDAESWCWKCDVFLGGGPQWSAARLGVRPILFICYINEMPDSIASFIYIYADDAKLFMTGRDQAMLLKDLDMLGEWSQIWHLRFNVDKCKVMRVGKPVEREPYVMQGVNGISSFLSPASCGSRNGSRCMDKLKFSDHVEHAVSKANQILGLIRRSFMYLDIPLLKQLHTTLVRPHLEYGNTVWHPIPMFSKGY